MVEQDKSEVDALESENESLKAKISELENQVKQTSTILSSNRNCANFKNLVLKFYV